MNQSLVRSLSEGASEGTYPSYWMAKEIVGGGCVIRGVASTAQLVDVDLAASSRRY